MYVKLNKINCINLLVVIKRQNKDDNINKKQSSLKKWKTEN